MSHSNHAGSASNEQVDLRLRPPLAGDAQAITGLEATEPLRKGAEMPALSWPFKRGRVPRPKDHEELFFEGGGLDTGFGVQMSGPSDTFFTGQ